MAAPERRLLGQRLRRLRRVHYKPACRAIHQWRGRKAPSDAAPAGLAGIRCRRPEVPARWPCPFDQSRPWGTTPGSPRPQPLDRLGSPDRHRHDVLGSRRQRQVQQRRQPAACPDFGTRPLVVLGLGLIGKRCSICRDERERRRQRVRSQSSLGWHRDNLGHEGDGTRTWHGRPWRAETWTEKCDANAGGVLDKQQSKPLEDLLRPPHSQERHFWGWVEAVDKAVPNNGIDENRVLGSGATC